MSVRTVSFVVDDHQCETVEVEMGVPQSSPVLLILFAIYLSCIFKEMEIEVEECIGTPFADDCRGWWWRI